MRRPPSRRDRATVSMTMAISGSAFLTAAAILASSWLMMRAISRADLVSSPSDAALAVSVVRSLNSSAPRLTIFDVAACSSMVRVAINIPAFLLSPFYSYGLGKALRKVCRRWYWWRSRFEQNADHWNGDPGPKLG